MMYVNKKKIVPFKLMTFEEESVPDSDSVLDAIQVEEEE